METYYGHVRSPADAIILFEACRLGLLPRVQRRLSEKERQSIRSGSVFVWDEREAGMRRWTDGKSWSASRVSGSFLTYREMEGKRGGHTGRGGRTPDSKGSDNDHDDGEEGPDGYRYKPDGLMKQSFSITTSGGQHLHLISYYARSHPTAQGLKQPSTDPTLSHIRPQKGLYPESSVNDQQNLPAVTRGPMPGAGYAVAPMTLPPFGRGGAVTPQYLPAPYGWPPGAPMPIAYGAHYLHPPLPGNVPVQPNGHPLPPYTTMHPPPPQYIYAQPSEPRYVSPFPPVPQPPQPLHHHLPSQQPQPQQQPQHQRHQPPPQHYHSQQQHQQQSHPSHLSPQLNGSPHSQLRSMTPTHQQLSPQIAPPHLAALQSSPDMMTSGTTGVPSISSMMNGVPSPSTMQSSPSPGLHVTNGDTPQYTNGTLDGHAQAHGHTASPAPMMSTPGPAPPGAQDIPSEKIGFREDERALRQLDRVFL
ncbi:hypothetical protein KEM56_002703 [Ascosphaera pollenicola]|nr:hypothetical protein KEM56_002703 [Ascosphaera pollenicola]